MAHGLLWWIWIGCGASEPVAWDATSWEDFGEDLLFVLFTGRVERDRAELLGPHVLGGRLSMDVSARSDAGTSLRFDVLEPSIASVTLVDVGEVSHEVDIQFLDEGTTELFVIADDGTVLDTQTLRVRAPVSAELTPWEELQATRSSGRPVVPRRPGTLHTVQGAFVDLALTWVDQIDARLVGGKLLSLLGDIPPRVDTSVSFTGEVDVLSLEVGANAPVETVAMELLAGGRSIAPLDLVVHDRAEVDAVTLDVAVGTNRGALQANVLAAGEPLLGAPVRFRWEQGQGEGTILLFQGDADSEQTTVSACYDGPNEEVCAETSVPGTPTGIAARRAPTGCGCQAIPVAPSLSWLRRRRAP